jgi:hypothetical protein
MKYRLVLFALAVLTACNSVTVVPIDDEDAGDGGVESSAPDASADG